ncbi:hypothetical protein Hanom_Chr08g00684891 [Helianthus anomalus]
MFGMGLSGLFLVPVSFGPGMFNGQDPPLDMLYVVRPKGNTSRSNIKLRQVKVCNKNLKIKKI